MPSARTSLLSSLVLLAMATGCPSAGVPLRLDGSPGPEKCIEDAIKAMRILRLQVGDSAFGEIDVNQTDTSPITLFDGPVESMLNEPLGPLESTTRLYGRVWTGGSQVVIRYYEARPPHGDVIPICAVARLSNGQLKKLPGSKPGMAVLEFSATGVFVVDSFR